MFNLSKIKKAYLIGIKGAGMTAVAQILKSRGIEISGSDTSEKFYTDEILKSNRIPFVEKFSAENVPSDNDVIIYSTAYLEKNNPEMARAKKLAIPLVSYPEVLGMLFQEKIGIAVCGTHGKTTTTAMLAECLRLAGAEPSAIVGSKVIGWGGGALSGKGRYFVAEADEYQNKFQYYNPFAVVLTSVDWDHPDFFPTFTEYKSVFENFVAKIPRHGFLVSWGDSSDVLDIVKEAECQVLKYGFREDNDIIISNIKYQISKSGQNIQVFEITQNDNLLGSFEIQLIGKHNILNAAAAVATCHKLNIDIDKVRKALRNFQGTARRFEHIGKKNSAILIDDYAHHPEEIKVTLKAAREIYPGKNIITVFHPHTYTRTKALLSEFSQSFDDANKVIVIDIYGSAREIQGGVSSKELVDLINKYDHDKAEYIPTINEVIDNLKDALGENDVVISMGAGDVWKVTSGLRTN
ncbi:MAG: UDP-N-acetylmuramate--L-alanine ligase [Candidatus Moranbacteria bacterium]|nr:UDP-N-acetylmuramate--L-alanine ligase [Candidatus Moranbacteria bacterium]